MPGAESSSMHLGCAKFICVLWWSLRKTHSNNSASMHLLTDGSPGFNAYVGKLQERIFHTMICSSPQVWRAFASQPNLPGTPTEFFQQENSILLALPGHWSLVSLLQLSPTAAPLSLGQMSETSSPPKFCDTSHASHHLSAKSHCWMQHKTIWFNFPTSICLRSIALHQTAPLHLYSLVFCPSENLWLGGMLHMNGFP